MEPAPLDRLWLSRTALAFWMIVVSAQGASVAFWIARTEQRSDALHRQLTRGQMIELSVRQSIAGDWSFRSALEARRREHQARADSLRDNAARVADDPSQAGQFEMLAQQELMLANLTSTLLVPFRDEPAGSDVKRKIDQQATAELARLGFSRSDLASASQPEPPSGAAEQPRTPKPVPADQSADVKPLVAPVAEPDVSFEKTVAARELPVWRPFSDAIHALHHHVPGLALGVVLFVGALVCLTTADLVGRNRRLATIAVTSGAIAAAGAAAAVLWWDPGVWRPLAVASVFSLGLAGAFRAAGLFAHQGHGETPHPPEFEHKQFLGIHLSLKHGLHVREQVMVGVIAVVVLLSSTVGWWFASAQTAANVATHRAFAAEVQLSNLDSERWLDASTTIITPTLELFQARMRCAFASQASVVPPAGASASTEAIFARERERDCQALNTTENKERAAVVDRVDFDTADRPGSALFAQERNRGPFNRSHLYALADGYISEAEHWEAKAVTYVLGLTLFAISLYLMSQAMGMGEGTPSSILAICGVLLALGTFTYAAAAYGRPVMPTPVLPEGCQATGTAVEVAATFYGRARAKYETATTGAEYQQAADLFRCALEARPDFGRAQYDRALAASLISQGDVDSNYSNFPTRSRVAEIQASQADMLRELERTHWVPTPRLLNSHGFNTFLAAMTEPSPALLDTAIDVLEQGIRESGLGTPEGTVDAVRLKSVSAADLETNQMLYTNLGLSRLAKGDWPNALLAYQAAIDGLRLSENRQLVAGSLSDLNILEASCAALHGEGSATCGAVWDGIKNARRILISGKVSPPAEASRGTLTGVEAWARASRVGWRGTVTGINPAADVITVVWSAYSDEWKTWRVVQPLFGIVNQKDLVANGRLDRVRVYDNSPSFCVPPGRYRVEFYINGYAVDTGKSLEMDVRGYRNYRSREMDFALCLPDDWKNASTRAAGDNRNLVQAFSTPQNSAVLYLFTLFLPIETGDWDGRAIDRAWEWIKRLTRSGSVPSDEAFRAAVERFKGCDRPIVPGTVLSRVWRLPNGLIRVAFVIGDAAPGGQACQVLESIGAYYGRDREQLLR